MAKRPAAVEALAGSREILVKSEKAHTLVELLVTVVVVALLVVLAVPSFGDMLASSRQRAEVNALFHAMHQAKKASITRNHIVTICASRDGWQCDNSRDWSGGWLMFENSDRDEPPRRDEDEPILRRHPGNPAVAVTSNRRSYSLRSTRLRATNGTIIVCDRERRIAPRAVVISTNGRPRITSENHYGKPYDCLY